MSTSPLLGERHLLQVPEGPIEYRVSGSGPTLVFLHGIIANADVWRGVVEDLARDHRCIAPDWPLGAHALAMHPGTDFSLPGLARMVQHFLIAAGLDQVVLVANDTGGAVAQYVAADCPERIAALVLTPCDAFDNFPPPVIRHLCLFGRRPPGLWLLAQALRWRWVQRLPIAFGRLTERPIPADIMRSYTAPLRELGATRRDFAALVRAIDSALTLAVAARLSAFRQPVLLLWAHERRRFFPLSHAHQLAQRFPNARVEVIEDSGPFVTEDQPAFTAAAIRRFVRDALRPARQPSSMVTEMDWPRPSRSEGAIPKLLRNERDKCAESLNPAACAASVQDAP